MRMILHIWRLGFSGYKVFGIWFVTCENQPFHEKDYGSETIIKLLPMHIQRHPRMKNSVFDKHPNLTFNGIFRRTFFNQMFPGGK